jgi:hypothetical protein
VTAVKKHVAEKCQACGPPSRTQAWADGEDRATRVMAGDITASRLAVAAGVGDATFDEGVGDDG